MFKYISTNMLTTQSILEARFEKKKLFASSHQYKISNSNWITEKLKYLKQT